MLKTSFKLEKKRQILSNKTYLFYVYQILNHFLVRNSSRIFMKYWKNLSHAYFSAITNTKVRSICILTGRSRSVYRFFRLSRLKIRAYSQAGYFIGLSKASW